MFPDSFGLFTLFPIGEVTMAGEHAAVDPDKRHKFEVHADGPSAVDVRSITLDGVELKGVESINVNLKSGQINTVSLGFVPGFIATEIEGRLEVQDCSALLLGLAKFMSSPCMTENPSPTVVRTAAILALELAEAGFRA